jgi:hypothetical protein
MSRNWRTPLVAVVGFCAAVILSYGASTARATAPRVAGKVLAADCITASCQNNCIIEGIVGGAGMTGCWATRCPGAGMVKACFAGGAGADCTVIVAPPITCPCGPGCSTWAGTVQQLVCNASCMGAPTGTSACTSVLKCQ